jgi:hypothetical protein
VFGTTSLSPDIPEEVNMGVGMSRLDTGNPELGGKHRIYSPGTEGRGDILLGTEAQPSKYLSCR